MTLWGESHGFYDSTAVSVGPQFPLLLQNAMVPSESSLLELMELTPEGSLPGPLLVTTPWMSSASPRPHLSYLSFWSNKAMQTGWRVETEGQKF